MTNKIVLNSGEKELVLVRGAPGSGKSTLAHKIGQHAGYDVQENDAFFTDKNGKYEFDIAYHQHAKDVCFEKTRESLNLGKSTVVANTFTTMKEMEPYLELARQQNIKVNVIEMELQYNNVHSVPDFVVKDKLDKFEPYISAQKVQSENYEIDKNNSLKNTVSKKKKPTM